MCGLLLKGVYHKNQIGENHVEDLFIKISIWHFKNKSGNIIVLSSKMRKSKQGLRIFFVRVHLAGDRRACAIYSEIKWRSDFFV